MPVTSFAMIAFCVIAAAALTVWALSAFGAMTVLPALGVVALAARWALTHVTHDEQS